MSVSFLDSSITLWIQKKWTPIQMFMIFGEPLLLEQEAESSTIIDMVETFLM